MNNMRISVKVVTDGCEIEEIELSRFMGVGHTLEIDSKGETIDSMLYGTYSAPELLATLTSLVRDITVTLLKDYNMSPDMVAKALTEVVKLAYKDGVMENLAAAISDKILKGGELS